MGQLGRSLGMTASAVPERVRGLDNIKAVAAGVKTSLAVRADGTAWAWGDNRDGLLGVGSLATAVDAPAQVLISPGVPLDRVTALAVGRLESTKLGVVAATHKLALLSDGSMRTWGPNGSGQLGDGTTSAATSPVRVIAKILPFDSPLFTRVRAVAAGGFHCLVIRDDGSVFGWGDNGWHQLAHAGVYLPGSLIPIAIHVSATTGLSGIMNIAAGDRAGLAIGSG